MPSDLDDVAKTKDLHNLPNIVASHTLEIQQLNDNLKEHTKRLQKLSTTLGQQGTLSAPDVYFTCPSQYGSAQASTPMSNPDEKKW